MPPYANWVLPQAHHSLSAHPVATVATVATVTTSRPQRVSISCQMAAEALQWQTHTRKQERNRYLTPALARKEPAPPPQPLIPHYIRLAPLCYQPPRVCATAPAPPGAAAHASLR